MFVHVDSVSKHTARRAPMNDSTVDVEIETFSPADDGEKDSTVGPQ